MALPGPFLRRLLLKGAVPQEAPFVQSPPSHRVSQTVSPDLIPSGSLNRIAFVCRIHNRVWFLVGERPCSAMGDQLSQGPGSFLRIGIPKLCMRTDVGWALSNKNLQASNLLFNVRSSISTSGQSSFLFRLLLIVWCVWNAPLINSSTVYQRPHFAKFGQCLHYPPEISLSKFIPHLPPSCATRMGLPNAISSCAQSLARRADEAPKRQRKPVGLLIPARPRSWASRRRAQQQELLSHFRFRSLRNTQDPQLPSHQ